MLDSTRNLTFVSSTVHKNSAFLLVRLEAQGPFGIIPVQSPNVQLTLGSEYIRREYSCYGPVESSEVSFTSYHGTPTSLFCFEYCIGHKPCWRCRAKRQSARVGTLEGLETRERRESFKQERYTHQTFKVPLKYDYNPMPLTCFCLTQNDTSSTLLHYKSNHPHVAKLSHRLFS